MTWPNMIVITKVLYIMWTILTSSLPQSCDGMYWVSRRLVKQNFLFSLSRGQQVRGEYQGNERRQLWCNFNRPLRNLRKISTYSQVCFSWWLTYSASSTLFCLSTPITNKDEYQLQVTKFIDHFSILIMGPVNALNWLPEPILQIRQNTFWADFYCIAFNSEENAKV